MSRVRRGFVALALLLATIAPATACGADEPARILVVTSEQDGPLDLDELVLTVDVAGDSMLVADERVEARSRYESGRLRPWSVTVLPRSPSDVGTVLHRFRVDGVRGGRAVVSRRARLAFIDSLTLTLPMRLAASCVYVECAEELTCEDGVCRDSVVPSCDLAPPGEPCREPSIDAGPPRDATPIDSSPRDVGPRDTGPRDAAPPPPPPRDMAPALDMTTCPATETACTDGLDGDCDALADCADPDCTGMPCDDANACTHGDACNGTACAGTAIVCEGDACNTRSCNGTATCTATPVADSTFCPDDGNPCSFDFCSGGACIHPQVFDNTVVFGSALCCGGALVDSAVDGAHCGVCGNDCGGRGCFGGVCRCSTNAECRGTCFDGVDLPACTGDGGGFLCQCQGDGDCLGGQHCCFESPPGCRHVCRFSCG